jgi:DNA polymerase-3 subunit delta'
VADVTAGAGSALEPVTGASLGAAGVLAAGAPWLAEPRARLAALRARGAHGLLLHGPAGVGKWELAMAFAADVLCERGAQVQGQGQGQAQMQACGSCASCVLLAAGNHPDLRVVVPDALADRRPGNAAEESEAAPAAEAAAAAKSKPSREIKIDQVRDLAALSSITAHRGGARVVALGPAEALNLPAANALLKGLEEPPPGMIFLLVADQIDRCLPTILSRCSLVRVAVPARAVALEWLRGQARVEHAEQRLTEAGGAPLAVLRESEEVLTPEVREGLLALLRRGAALDAAEVAGQVPRTLPIAAAVALFQRWGWDYFSYRLGGGLRYHPGDAASFEGLARHWRLPAAGAWMDRLRSLKAVADHPLNPRAAVEGVLLDYIDSITHS